MALTNAERQARHRQRIKARLQAPQAGQLIPMLMEAFSLNPQRCYLEAIETLDSLRWSLPAFTGDDLEEALENGAPAEAVPRLCEIRESVEKAVGEIPYTNADLIALLGGSLTKEELKRRGVRDIWQQVTAASPDWTAEGRYVTSLLPIHHQRNKSVT